MKSSGAVFSRQNPFQPTSRAERAHYHPSRNQPLSKKERKTNLSPVRSNQRSSPQLHNLSSESHRLYKEHDRQCAATDGPVFEESWPSTESELSPASTTNSSDVEKLRQSERDSIALSEPGAQQDSVLAKYIERFRHGPPQSREERQQVDAAIGEKQLPFWWTPPSPSPPSSTPNKTTDRDVFHPLKDDHRPEQRQHDQSLSPCRQSLSILSDTSHGEFDDSEVLHLQERADKLLLRDECSLSDGSVHVSSEGLGSSDFSFPVSLDDLPRRPLIPSFIKSTTVKDPESYQISSVIPSLVPSRRPEEDILFQWRLMRKMEQAREWTQPLQSIFHGPTSRWQASSLGHPSASGQAYKEQQNPEFSQKASHAHIAETKDANASCPPASGPHARPAFVVSGSSFSQPQATAHVPTHMHLLCDVLPCPVQSSQASRQQSGSHGTDESHAHKETRLPGSSMNAFTEEPIWERLPSPSPASSGAVEEKGPSQHKTSEKNEKAQANDSGRKKATSYKKLKKSRYTVDKEHADISGTTNRSSSLQRVPKKVAEQLQQRGGREASTVRCTDGYAAPPSPIHSALGQVVSEVLFPTADSSPARRTPISSASPPCVAAAPPQSPFPPCDAQNSVEVISQLLQEAEDSDEKEFEDDPLLQVLRKQRAWVKRQISEVDSLSTDLLDEQ